MNSNPHVALYALLVRNNISEFFEKDCLLFLYFNVYSGTGILCEKLWDIDS